MSEIIPSHVSQKNGPGGLPVLHVTNALGQAEVLLHGAHVLSFQPAGAAPVLWLSAHSPYAEGKAVRGGVPVDVGDDLLLDTAIAAVEGAVDIEDQHALLGTGFLKASPEADTIFGKSWSWTHFP